MCYSEKYGDNWGVTKTMKGPPIRNDTKYERRSLEVRINLQRKLLRVASLPNYESVVEANNPDNINPSESYRFALSGLNENTKMTIVKLAKV